MGVPRIYPLPNFEHPNLGGVFNFYFHPWGFMIQFDEHIFQLGGEKPPSMKNI